MRVFFFFNKLKVGYNLAWGKSIGLFQQHLLNLVSLWNISVILTIFQAFSLLLYVWSLLTLQKDFDLLKAQVWISIFRQEVVVVVEV